jgi:hypothetical protein
MACWTYVITIHDRSPIHNFHLTGPGVNKKTSVPATGTTRWTVKLTKGTYRFVCGPHVATMVGVLKVSDATTSIAPPKAQVQDVPLTEPCNSWSRRTGRVLCRSRMTTPEDVLSDQTGPRTRSRGWREHAPEVW